MPASGVRPSPRASAACFIAGAAWFCGGLLLMGRAATDVVASFYQPRCIAIAHCFALGWASSLIMGVLYQYVPALTKQRVPWPRLVWWQIGFFQLGASGLVSHFWLGEYNGMAWSAGMLAAAVWLFVAELVVPLWRARRYDATVVGLGAALLYLAGTATLGLLFAVNKLHGFLPGDTLSNIAGHAHLGLLGWIGLTICAVSYRMVTAFLQPESGIPTAAAAQIVSLAVLVPSLVVALLLRSAITSLLAGLIVANLVWYGVNLGQLMRTRRLPLDWAMAHLLAGFASLMAAGACALLLVFAPDVIASAVAQVVVAYGVLLLVGWTSNTIIGIGTRMLSGLMARGPAPLLSRSAQVALFVLLNVGVAVMVAGIAAASARALAIAVWAPLGAGVVFTVALARRARTGPLARA